MANLPFIATRKEGGPLISIRQEVKTDIEVIRQITREAFENNQHSNGTEGAIIDALRATNQLSLSLVALIRNEISMQDEIVGHIAFSPVTIENEFLKWYGLGPVSVAPSKQRLGVGSALIGVGLNHLKEYLGAKGCVVVGDPDYYKRFGFKQCMDLKYEGISPEYFMQIAFNADTLIGRVDYHDSFNAS
ncbi:GNAT family N-acetyltransferase [Bartonella sp. HY038]|uniref:GNAT family N-acetyltransferase n=1 Tax=Bartonella sp. HY038 TaxID=2759660 RepID=UPI0015F96BDB|nr:N-acetyltransferase [Bartonella sp. HY038]